ncbi:ficolin-1-like [Ostrea edulis]|uniref:ficolin-1-like n=1 Tax=Ostrea edulis TaxID=37623 RepID=UPI0024AF8DD8|nr:ficolin-1-like [Ostrea edulis]
MDGEEKMVYCDMTTEGGGWTIIQKRIDGSTSFYRTWDNYKTGFGEPSKNYWIGNDAIHNLTKANNQELRVDITMNSGEKVYAKYSIFRVGDETSKYRIIINGFSGTAGDGFVGLDGRKFSTHDNDNDSSGRTNCASLYGSAWWYAGCGFSDLNGNYWMSNSKYFMFWRIRRSMKETIMMIRTKK